MEIVFVSESKVVVKANLYLRLWTSGQGTENQRRVNLGIDQTNEVVDSPFLNILEHFTRHIN